MFRTVPLSIMRSFTLYTQQWYLSHRSARKQSADLYDIYHCYVYSEKLLMMDRGTVRNMYSFISKNKFEKLVHLVGFIIRIYHDARSHEQQIRIKCYLIKLSVVRLYSVSKINEHEVSLE